MRTDCRLFKPGLNQIRAKPELDQIRFRPAKDPRRAGLQNLKKYYFKMPSREFNCPPEKLSTFASVNNLTRKLHICLPARAHLCL